MSKYVHSANEQMYTEHLLICQVLLLLLILSTTLENGFYCLHFTDEETEAWPREVILPASQSWEAAEPGSKVRHQALKKLALEGPGRTCDGFSRFGEGPGPR